MTTGRLHDLGMKHGSDKATHHGFCDFYEAHLPDNVGRLLEIGVLDGASLRMWRDYYPDADITGLDIRPCEPVDGCTILQGDATDWDYLARLGTFDVIVDDGSHKTHDQQRTFNYLYYRALNPGGWYVMEDLHTSFNPDYVNTKVTTFSMLKTKPGVLFWTRTDQLSDSTTALVPARGEAA